MSIDDLLRAAGRMSPDTLAVRRAYRRLEDEHRRRGVIRRWDTELVLLPEDKRTHLLRLTGLGETLSWQSHDFAATCRVPDESELSERAKFLAYASAIAVGAHVLGDAGSAWALDRAVSAEPVDNERADRLEMVLRALERLFDQEGSASCRPTLHAVLSEPMPAWSSAVEERVWLRFLSNLAKLHNLAGWVAFDLGSVDIARQHLGRALELARAAHNHLLLAHVLYRVGRMYLHVDAPADALKMFQLSRLQVYEDTYRLLVALIIGNEAWAYACLGEEAQAIRTLGRMKDEFARMDATELELLRAAQESGRNPARFVDDIVAGLERQQLTRTG